MGKLVDVVQKNYNRICDIWTERADTNINLKKKLVIDAQKNAEISKAILKYRSIVNEELVQIMFELQDEEYEKALVTGRVKAQNSIEYKIDSYVLHHEEGRIPIKKCLNDLLGIRMILDEEFSHQDVERYMKHKFPNFKCIDSSKLSYTATHIYFERDNFCFPWELQVWAKKDEENNYVSHKMYKQEYTRWEME